MPVSTVQLYARLGNKVTTRTISWRDQVTRAWGGEFNAPDHNIYYFSNGRGFDSTDRGKTGIYGISGVNRLLIRTASGNQYPDMAQPVYFDQSAGYAHESRLLQDNGYQILLGKGE